MRFSSSFVGFVPLVSVILAAPSELRPRDLNSFVAQEKVIALQGALNNIGPNGVDVPGAGSGFVVASPSKVNPDCTLLPFENNSRLC
jgi:glucoamylase